jgi:hypothetical protein
MGKVKAIKSTPSRKSALGIDNLFAACRRGEIQQVETCLEANIEISAQDETTLLEQSYSATEIPLELRRQICALLLNTFYQKNKKEFVDTHFNFTSLLCDAEDTTLLTYYFTLLKDNPDQLNDLFWRLCAYSFKHKKKLHDFLLNSLDQYQALDPSQPKSNVLTRLLGFDFISTVGLCIFYDELDFLRLLLEKKPDLVNKRCYNDITLAEFAVGAPENAVYILTMPPTVFKEVKQSKDKSLLYLACELSSFDVCYFCLVLCEDVTLFDQKCEATGFSPREILLQNKNISDSQRGVLFAAYKACSIKDAVELKKTLEQSSKGPLYVNYLNSTIESNKKELFFFVFERLKNESPEVIEKVLNEHHVKIIKQAIKFAKLNDMQFIDALLTLDLLDINAYATGHEAALKIHKEKMEWFYKECLCTPLTFAIELNRADIVAKLLNHPKIDVNLIDGNGNTPFHAALLSGNSKIINLLLDKKVRIIPETISQVLQNLLADTTTEENLKKILSLIIIEQIKQTIPAPADLFRVALKNGDSRKISAIFRAFPFDFIKPWINEAGKEETGLSYALDHDEIREEVKKIVIAWMESSISRGKNVKEIEKTFKPVVELLTLGKPLQNLHEDLNKLLWTHSSKRRNLNILPINFKRYKMNWSEKDQQGKTPLQYLLAGFSTWIDSRLELGISFYGIHELRQSDTLFIATLYQFCEHYVSTDLLCAPENLTPLSKKELVLLEKFILFLLAGNFIRHNEVDIPQQFRRSLTKNKQKAYLGNPYLVKSWDDPDVVTAKWQQQQEQEKDQTCDDRRKASIRMV